MLLAILDSLQLPAAAKVAVKGILRSVPKEKMQSLEVDGDVMLTAIGNRDRETIDALYEKYKLEDGSPLRYLIERCLGNDPRNQHQVE